MPKVVAVSDYGKTLTVEWSPPDADTAAAGHVTYVLQERHHVGAEYVAERMTAWTTVTRTDRTQEQLRQLYAPGRWFQFRVAAVNENGTRGYSPPSAQFFVQLGPRECYGRRLGLFGTFAPFGDVYPTYFPRRVRAFGERGTCSVIGNAISINSIVTVYRRNIEHVTVYKRCTRFTRKIC